METILVWMLIIAAIAIFFMLVLLIDVRTSVIFALTIADG
jgi:hypothetical protein